MLPISNSFQAAAVVWSLSHVEYIGVFKSQQTFLCTSVVCFPGQEAVRGSFLLKPADTLILKQPQEANLHLNHFRCFHRKSAQKHLFFFFPSFVFQLPCLTSLSSNWGIYLNSWSMMPTEEAVLFVCYIMGSCSAIELYCMSAQRTQWKSLSEGLKTVAFRGEMGGIKKE